ncbi:MAG: M48 family metalloprotease [Spirochaetaceae bacterium]|jgi:predicted Zn-dependent protease|nr:M48 family metalloprotease [Spirochaetaceae bacterium]
MKKVLAIPILICLATALGAQNQGQNNEAPPYGKKAPVTDVMDALSEMDRIFETPDEPLTLKDEYYLGRTVAARILHTYKPYTGDPALVSYLNKICQALVINSPRQEAFNGYQAGILDTPEINAFATPGGHIFLTRGLVAYADSEDVLAAVLAHELAHIQLRHAAAMIDDQRIANDLSPSADRAASIALRNAGPQKQALFTRHISGMVNTLFKNGFSREQEFAADVTAAGLLDNAGYDPAALIRMLEILETTQSLHPGGFTTTHPPAAARITNLKNVVLTGQGSETRVYRDYRFTFFHDRITRTR